MGTDEMQIYDFLKTAPNSYASEREIARQVGGKARLKREPDWIRPVLTRMVRDEIIETDGYGQYRIKLREVNKPQPQKLTMDNWEKWQLVLEEEPKEETRGVRPTPPRKS